MKSRQFLPLTIIILLLFMFVHCGENPFETKDKVTPPQIESAKGDHGGGGKGGKPGDTDIMRGGDFGDLYILWRNAEGEPIYIEVESEEHGTTIKVQPIAFEGEWVSDGEKWVGVPDIDYEPPFDDEYFYKEAYAYVYWDGFYNVGSFAFDSEWGALLGTATVDETVVPYNAEGDLDFTYDHVPASVELGRKNLSRSPQAVLDRALAEAMKTLTLDGDPLKLDYCGRLIGKTVTTAGLIEDKTIDSPRENMAIYQSLMLNDGFGGLDDDGKVSALCTTHGLTWLDIAASCYAAAADKSDNLTVDEIVYINEFLGINGEVEDEDKHYDHYTTYTYDTDRERYKTRWIMVLTIVGQDVTREVLSVYEAAFGYTDGEIWHEPKFLLTDKYYYETKLAGFRTAADDAMQVLDYIHGDSNIEWLGHADTRPPLPLP